MKLQHQAVLLSESIEALAIQPDGIYLDGTFGRGGHSQAILEHLSALGRLIVMDKDLDAISYAKDVLGEDKRVTIVHASFSTMAEVAKAHGIFGEINGVLLDLGVSSPQLDNPERGFSFMQHGPLDMRMNQLEEESAHRFINTGTANTLAQVFKAFGEERFAGRIARAIVQAREEQGPIETTSQLASIVKQANPKWERHKHPATRVFQAIRIHVNRELDELAEGLEQAYLALAPGGRIAVISFHSLEDRIVKRFMRSKEEGPQVPMGVPLRATELVKKFKRVGKAMKPSEQEQKENIRSRSAVLRIGEKLI